MKPLILVLITCVTFTLKAQYYFPPLTGTTWDTVSASQLGWCTDPVDSMYQMLEEKGTKAFLVLKDGKLVFEKYFGTFTQDSPWYWASAGKTITAFLTGMAQQEGFLSLSDSVSKYLDTGWTSCPPEKEKLITIRNQLNMTTGLDYIVPDPDCKDPSCLTYKSDAGTQWFYHNAPYLLLSDVIASATGMFYQQYTNTRLMFRTGMSGIWLNGVFYSRPRTMARFGSLILNRGIWASDTLMRDTAYFNQMVNTSQSYNLSYGYLWWLNGKSSFRLPGSTITFPGKIIRNAPDDLIAALGKNDQKLYVWPSRNIVVVRMGNSADLSPVPIVLDTLIWSYLNRIICTPLTGSSKVSGPEGDVAIYPNPAQGTCYIQYNGNEPIHLEITDITGRLRLSQSVSNSQEPILIRHLESGVYVARFHFQNRVVVKRLMVNE